MAYFWRNPYNNSNAILLLKRSINLNYSMTNEALLDQQTQNIIKRYMVLYKVIFQYSIFFVPLLLGALRAWSLQSTAVIARYYPKQEVKFQSYVNT
jgi:hypothetical protein